MYILENLKHLRQQKFSANYKSALLDTSAFVQMFWSIFPQKNN